VEQLNEKIATLRGGKDEANSIQLLVEVDCTITVNAIYITFRAKNSVEGKSFSRTNKVYKGDPAWPGHLLQVLRTSWDLAQWGWRLWKRTATLASTISSFPFS
jgi:hypothetical protein